MSRWSHQPPTARPEPRAPPLRPCAGFRSISGGERRQSAQTDGRSAADCGRKSLATRKLATNWPPTGPKSGLIAGKLLIPLPGFEASFRGLTSAGSFCKSPGSWFLANRSRGADNRSRLPSTVAQLWRGKLLAIVIAPCAAAATRTVDAGGEIVAPLTHEQSRRRPLPGSCEFANAPPTRRAPAFAHAPWARQGLAVGFRPTRKPVSVAAHFRFGPSLATTARASRCPRARNWRISGAESCRDGHLLRSRRATSAIAVCRSQRPRRVSSCRLSGGAAR